MKSSLSAHARALTTGLGSSLALSVFSVTFVLSNGVIASELQTTIVRVEEDWELTLGEPDSNSAAPQTTCVFTPNGTVAAVHATFEINYQGLPKFAAGGLQLQIWDGEFPVESRKFSNDSVLATSGETVRWTQAMQIQSGQIVFEIINGDSKTWGKFGGEGYLKANVNTSISNLNDYKVEACVKNSGIGYAANRVKALLLKKVRVYTADGRVVEEDVSCVVHKQD